MVVAVGWAKDGAEQEEIAAAIQSEVARARRSLGGGEGLRECAECGDEIPEARRRAVPGVRRCVTCQAEADRQEVQRSHYNRRGNKDSQLK
jgi:phage/conjugal plasmid C-4 type zinc finger TraR family protein